MNPTPRGPQAGPHPTNNACDQVQYANDILIQQRQQRQMWTEY